MYYAERHMEPRRLGPVRQDALESLPLERQSGTNAEVATGWEARLELGFARSGSRTALVHRRHWGPYVVQRPFREPGGGCQTYVLHPPGGLAHGDRLMLDVEARTSAQVVLTTVGATKIYKQRSNAPKLRSCLEQSFRVETDAFLEWLPLETIVFDGAVADTLTRVDLDPGARYLGWEISCLGRPASALPFQSGEYVQSTRIRTEGVLCFGERLAIGGGLDRDDPCSPSSTDIRLAPWGLSGMPVIGTLIAVGFPEVDAAMLRQVEAPADRLSVSRKDRTVICRYLGQHAHQARSLFSSIRSRIHAALGRPAFTPRIWST